MDKIVMSWSGGKDSVLALRELWRMEEYEVSGLVTTVTAGYGRTSMHGVRRELMERQAVALGCPLEVIMMKPGATDEEFNNSFREYLEKKKADGIMGVGFGDIFMVSVRKHREENLEKVGMEGIYPIWGRNTMDMAMDFINRGFKAVVTCIDSKVIRRSCCGQEYDENFLRHLPNSVDPCGENGEFHTFVYDGSIFEKRVDFKQGEIVLRDERFYYMDMK